MRGWRGRGGGGSLVMGGGGGRWALERWKRFDGMPEVRVVDWMHDSSCLGLGSWRLAR